VTITQSNVDCVDANGPPNLVCGHVISGKDVMTGRKERERDIVRENYSADWRHILPLPLQPGNCSDEATRTYGVCWRVLPVSVVYCYYTWPWRWNQRNIARSVGGSSCLS